MKNLKAQHSQLTIIDIPLSENIISQVLGQERLGNYKST